MKSKKIFAMLTAAALCLTVSSCGGNESEQVPETAAAETTAEGKKIIKLTAYGMNSDYKTAVNDFNKTNDEYEIEVTDNFSLEKSDALTLLNLEIISGNAPDIISTYGLPMESYAEKGLLADFYDFIDNDPEMSREDFLENIFKACEINGGLYENITYFYLNIISGKQSIAGEMQGRTSDDFIGLAEKYPDKKFMDWQFTKDYTFGFFMMRGWESFVDKDTGKCDFCNERFYRILKFSNTFPDKVDQSYQFEPNWRRNEADDLRNEKTLFASYGMSAIVSDFYSLRKLEDQVFGERAAVIGYPYAEGNGAIINVDNFYSVFENSPVKEGAWEFLRYFYTDEYQKELIFNSDAFPVKRSALEFAAEDAKKGFYQSYLNDYSDAFSPNTDEDNQRIIDLVEGAACRRDDTSENFVYNIILEEAEMYFSGQRHVEETAEIIQNRVQNYLDENR
ncbi:MAG: extracellular solute-binding protein [Ruminococcus sp.]|nr:extracellular solute-binding protein [Ruminococcus sp.]